MPPTGRFLLDTNIVIALLAAETPVVAGVRDAEAVFLSAIVVGELYYGARRSRRSRENIERIATLAAGAAVLPCDVRTAATYGQVKAELSARGTPIPENDVWIAAAALQHSLTLVSRDGHFEEVPGLALERWD